MTILKGNDPSIPDSAGGVDLRWLREYSLQLTDAPAWYSLRARMDGHLCGSCDLALEGFSCACPPSEPIDGLIGYGKITSLRPGETGPGAVWGAPC